MKGIECCGECAYYSMKEHKCMDGAKDHGKAEDSFYADCPHVEAEPLRHGRWIEESANEYYCSYCGKYAPIAKNMRHCDCSKWCKECGTKMDGGAEDVRSKTD